MGSLVRGPQGSGPFRGCGENGGKVLGQPHALGLLQGYCLGRHQGCFLGSFQGHESNLVRAALELLDFLRVRGRQVPHSFQGTDRAREGVRGTTGGWPVSLSRSGGTDPERGSGNMDSSKGPSKLGRFTST